MDDLKENIDLEINGQLMPADTYEIKKYVNGGIKIVAVYRDRTDLEKWATGERERIFKNPEEYTPEEHEMIFTKEEITNLHNSMRP